MALPTTSGTVSQYAFDQTKVIDHAFRRAGLAAEMASAENLIIAQSLIFTILSEWVNAGFPLWTRENVVLAPAAIGDTDVVTPAGTVDVIHAYWRSLNPWRSNATTSSGANAATLFQGAPTTDIVIPGPNPGVIVSFGTTTELDTIGVMLGGSTALTAALEVQVSADGLADYTTFQTLPSTTFEPGQWQYFDLNPTTNSAYVQLVSPGASAWTLQQLNFGLANASNIELGKLNIDDYYNLPNPFERASISVSCFIDRQLNEPVIKIWPTLNAQGFYGGCVMALIRRYIQDPGSMTNAVEVPQRALEALIWRLATMLIYEIPDADASAATSYFSLMAKQQRIQALETKASKAESLFWAEERTKAPIRIAPNLRPYTQ